jgi:hypothetical protein
MTGHHEEPAARRGDVVAHERKNPGFLCSFSGERA